MNRLTALGMGMLVGFALGATAISRLQAQSKPKAYTITEAEVLDAAAQAAYNPLIQAEIKAAGGRVFRTGGGRIVAFVGAAPKRVAINEWDSPEQAQAFFTSKAYKDLAPQRDKAVRTIRRYVVEAQP